MVVSGGDSLISDPDIGASGQKLATARLTELGSNSQMADMQFDTSNLEDRIPVGVANSLVVLLAEDNPPDVLLLRQAIKSENLALQVHVAQDGEKALRFIAAAGEEPGAPIPQLLLLDLNLPKIDGLTILRKVRDTARFKQLPVLVLTSSNLDADRDDAARLGAMYFRKPTTYEEFLQLGPSLRSFLSASGLI